MVRFSFYQIHTLEFDVPTQSWTEIAATGLPCHRRPVKLPGRRGRLRADSRLPKGERKVCWHSGPQTLPGKSVLESKQKTERGQERSTHGKSARRKNDGAGERRLAGDGRGLEPGGGCGSPLGDTWSRRGWSRRGWPRAGPDPAAIRRRDPALSQVAVASAGHSPAQGRGSRRHGTQEAQQKGGRCAPCSQSPSVGTSLPEAGIQRHKHVPLAPGTARPSRSG